MLEQREQIIIGGVNQEGKKFRPSDWVERLAAILSSFGEDQRLKYDKCARPCTIKGIRSLVIDGEMKENIPQAYEFIMNFARNNHLKIQVDRRTQKQSSPPQESSSQKERRRLGNYQFNQ